jgi:hypothetical protein
MAKINVTGSAYRVPRGKAEIARDRKWQKTAKLTSKKSQESKKGRDQHKISEAENSGSLVPGKADEPMAPEAPDKNKK